MKQTTKMNMPVFVIFALIFTILSVSGRATSKDLVCGIAIGFPPYQFQKNNTVSGFDTEVVRLVSQKLNRNFVFKQDQWDVVFNELRYGKIDFIAGMEVTEMRSKLFDFTIPYYSRYDVIFIREDNKDINKIEDLYYEVISGDRHSFVESYWKEKDLINKFRIMQTISKEKSMQLLYSGKIKAAIMPKAVGFYLAKKIGLKVKILKNPDPGSPVAIAVKKGNYELLSMFETVLEELIKQGEIDTLYNNWILNCQVIK